VDLNNDGLMDVLLGEYNGRVKYYEAVTADSLTEMDDVQAGGDYIDAGLVSAPCIFDWDDDGVYDLLVGFASPGSQSSVQLYMNSGTPENPVFDAGVDVLCGGEQIQEAGCTPIMADLDQDGLDDLIFGVTTGGVFFCRNIGTPSAPEFESQEALQTPSGDINLQLNSSPAVDDWNEDGYPDLIAGRGETGYVLVFLSPYTGIASGEEVAGCQIQLLSNPCTGTLDLAISMPLSAQAELEVHDICGRLVSEYPLGTLPAGNTSMQLDVGTVPSGVYFITVITGDLRHTCIATILGGP
jgi:hypothetical protein